jgi:hypothetical protein
MAKVVYSMALDLHLKESWRFGSAVVCLSYASARP